ncbi:MFS transporter [Scytonema hofmannii PCC 7110]|uniref:MFS transporter n=1 Tax=Scytonema hofmannii PCC 7110 TaxID=128403 RepID=A0A139WX45_9CYAN|nr:MFS transporter [Scytonema hofmannii]KYC37000.1 MFS transporter [Scytonema hofmannii PCC 7110]
MLRDRKLLVLLLAGSLTTMAGGIVAPVLPEMAQQLNLNPGLAAHLVSIHCLTNAVFSPLLGILADRVGRLRVLIASLLLYALSGTAGGFMRSIELLLVTRSLLGIASGGIAAASLGLLAGMYEGQARSQALGQATSTLTIAGIFFPLLGGWVGSSNWHFTFYLYGLGLPLAIFVALTLRTKQSVHKKANVVSTRDKLRQVFSNQSVLWLLLTLGLASIVMYSVVIYTPLYLKQTIGVGAVLNGVVLASRAVGAAAISAFGARQLAKNIGTERSIAVGFGLMALTLATIPLLRELSLILITAVLFGVGFGIVMPNIYSILANLAPVELRASVLAAGTGAGFLGQFLCPILLGQALNYGGIEAIFYTSASLSLASAVLLIFFSTNGKLAKKQGLGSRE